MKLRWVLGSIFVLLVSAATLAVQDQVSKNSDEPGAAATTTLFPVSAVESSWDIQSNDSSILVDPGMDRPFYGKRTGPR
jgi:hypothetical protein